MKPLAVPLLVALLAPLASPVSPAVAAHSAPPAAALDGKVEAYLDAQRDRWIGGFSDADGKRLYDLILAHRYTRVVEIGTGTGHSAIWMAWALSKTGGKLTTIEINEARCREAATRLQDAGLSEFVEVRCADALELLPRLPGPFDLVFMDAPLVLGKEFFEAASPKLVVGGRYLTHGVGEGRPPEYVGYLKGLKNYETRFDTGGEFSASRKKSDR